ncbi:MAG: OmpA family protein [Planctomycetes bacterium]|nr:OmpA family protein [Planctomycetota bacterium]
MAARGVVKGVLAVAALALLAAGMTGCEEQQLKAQIVDLRVQLRNAEAENANLGAKLTDVEAKSAQYEAEAVAARADADKARQELAMAKGASKGGDDNAAPPPPKPVAEQIFTLADPFMSGKAVLKPTATAELGRIAEAIKRDYPGRMIRVEGHTDGDPIKKSGWKDNWELSCERAATVVRQLVASGVSAENVCVAGYGEHQPVADNKTAAGKSKNRRVEIVVTSR